MRRSRRAVSSATPTRPGRVSRHQASFWDNSTTGQAASAGGGRRETDSRDPEHPHLRGPRRGRGLELRDDLGAARTGGEEELHYPELYTLAPWCGSRGPVTRGYGRANPTLPPPDRRPRRLTSSGRRATPDPSPPLLATAAPAAVGTQPSRRRSPSSSPARRRRLPGDDDQASSPSRRPR